MQLSREELLQAYRAMATIRRFEERVQEEFSKGGIPGFVHLYAGEEASAVGVCSHLGDRGLHRQHPSRPRPLDRQGLRSGADDAGVVRQEGRAVRRQGRLDAHRRSRPRHARRQRHRRRRPAAGGRRGAERQDPGPRHCRGLVHRRRRLQPGHHLRGDEFGGGAETAGDLRLREQPVRRGHRGRLRRRQPRHRRPRRGLRPARGQGQRRRFLRGPRGGRRGRRARPRRRRPERRSRSIPAAFTATIRATRSSIAARTRSGACATSATA